MNKPIKFTKEENEVITGALLGDGHVSHDSKKSGAFHYSSSEEEHVKFVWKKLKRLSAPRYVNGPVKREIFDKRTEKNYTRYEFRSKNNLSFYELRRFWYKGKKIIPRNLVLTPLTALVWYIGDGSLDKVDGYIKIGTDCFSKNENKFLVGLLGFCEASLFEKSNRIYIPRRKVDTFLSFIGKCPVTCYKYKWEQKVLINKEPNDYNKLLPKIRDRFLAGDKIKDLRKEFGVPHRCITNFLENEGVEFCLSNKKMVCQIKNGKIIKIWNSLKETKGMGFSPSGVSQCCNGKRKTHKGYTWRFKDE